MSGARRYPPGPAATSAFYYLWRTRRDPLAFFGEMARTYGDVSHFQSGRQHVYLVNNPDLARELLVTKNGAFIKGRALTRSRQVVGDGLLANEGDTHRVHLQLIRPSLHHRRVLDYGRLMEQTARDRARAWSAGGTLNLTWEMQRLTLALVGLALFGFEPAQSAGDAAACIGREVDRLTLPALSLFERLPLPSNRRFARNVANLQRTADRIIARRLEQPAGSDLLWSLVSAAEQGTITRSEVRDEILTFLLVGHATVTNLLIWSWVTLADHPDVEARLHAEVDAIDDAPGAIAERAAAGSLPYTRAVAAEMLRLMPPVWMIGRRAVSACDIGGYDIPVGALVEVSPYLLHRDARYFADPLRFDPSRWLPERDWTPVKFSYIPFGAGARGCIGEPFAWLEATTIIASVARRWRLRLAPGTRVEPFAGLTLRPKRAVRMVPLRRHAD